MARCAGGKVDNAGIIPSLNDNLPCGGGKVKIESINAIPIVIANVIEILLTVIAILAVIFIIVAAIRYITSGGDSNRVQSAKSTLSNAIAGLILSSSAFLIVSFLASRL